MNILIPMAGAGSRFTNKGMNVPKPLTDILGQPMINHVVKSLRLEGNYIYVVRTEHYEKFGLSKILNDLTPNCKIVLTDKLTEGAACSALLAADFIDNNEPLLISDCDSIVDFDKKFLEMPIDGAILTFEDKSPTWSFVDSPGYYSKIKKVAEKEPISNFASSGRYYWARGKDFVTHAKEMIKNNLKIKNEFYISPVYNLAIEKGLEIWNIPVTRFINLGTPEELHDFILKFKSNS
jgi:dTDP-glucose pyrophosphorylase